MPKDPNKKTRNLRSVIQKAPCGEFVLAVWDWEGGIMGKILIGMVVVVCFLIYLHFSNQQPSQTTTTTGKDSPATVQSATASGNSTVIQAAPGAIVFNGISDASIEIIRQGMLALQKQKNDELIAKFNLGYILFTATDRNEIIPLNSPMDEMLKVDWKSGYNVSFSSDAVTLKIPDLKFISTNGSTMSFQGMTVTLNRRFEPFARPGFVQGNNRLAFKVVSTNEDSIVIAMGIESPPEPMPPMSELMKYN